MDLREYIGLGVAGNFARHLEQAGELEDFKNVVAKEGAPKGVFPFYLPKSDSFLNIFPLSSKELILRGNTTAQVEPEVAIYCDIIYEDNRVADLVPKSFSAFNDCTIRKDGASKISEKKNWGESSKGASTTLIDIDRFSYGGIMDNYRLASFVKRDGAIYPYGEDSELLGYSYFYDTLKEWLIDKINTQKDENPLEDIAQILKENNYPKNAVITIGATTYSSFGQSNYLQDGDKVFVVVYPKNIKNIKEYIEKEKEPKDSSVLIQNVK